MAEGDQHGYLHQSRKQFLPPEEGGCEWWNEPRTFSRWEAWQDMIQSAAYREHTRMVGGMVVALRRGETPPRSITYLAKRWRWSTKQVRRFLDLAREMSRIRAHQETPKGHTYLIVNYGVYQPEGHARGTEKGTRGAREGHARGTKKKEGEVKGSKNKSPDGDLFGAQEGAEEPKSRKPRKRDLLWEAMVEVCGIENPIPKSARDAYNRACKDLRDAGAEPDEVRKRAEVYRRQWPHVSLTPTALARRWPECSGLPKHVQDAEDAEEWGPFHQLKQEKMG